MNALRRVEIELDRELSKQIDIMYAASAVIWWKDYGWRNLRIMRRFVTTREVWDECAAYGIDKSMLQMLEEETGIEMRLSGFDKSYHDLAYMDGAAWDGKQLTLAQTIYMHQQQKKWLGPLILACICLSLHRDEHWGAERIARFIGQVDAMRQQLGEKPKAYMDLMLKETEIPKEAIWKTARSTKD